MVLYHSKFKTNIGYLYSIATDKSLLSLSFKKNEFFGSVEKKKNPIIDETKNQIKFYMKGKKINFNIPLNPKGTLFQRKVWGEIKKIKWGKKSTYNELSKKIFKKKIILGPRAVGNACLHNPIILLIPCHRIISSNGSLGGYNYRLWRKKKLLSLEK